MGLLLIAYILCKINDNHKRAVETAIFTHLPISKSTSNLTWRKLSHSLSLVCTCIVTYFSALEAGTVHFCFEVSRYSDYLLCNLSGDFGCVVLLLCVCNVNLLFACLVNLLSIRMQVNLIGFVAWR